MLEMDNREERFLDYNNDNIFINLLQLETHLRNLDDLQTDESQVSCLAKHLAEAEGEASEAISHSATVKPEKTSLYRKVKEKLYELRKNLPSYSPDGAILKVREIRKIIEKAVPAFNTENCIACEKLDAGVRKVFKSGSNNTFTEKKVGQEREVTKEMVLAKDVGVVAGSQFAGKLVEVLADQVDVQLGQTGAPAFARASTWINIGGGLAATLGGLVGLKSNPTAQLAAIVAGTHMLTKVVDVAEETMVPTAAAATVPTATIAPVSVGETSGRYFQRQLAPQAFAINGGTYSKDVFVD